MMHKRKKITLSKPDLLVVGGGVAGCVAAVTAARLGVRTMLVHNRPMLGGPSSAECCANADGSFICGASEYVNANARECGVLDEMKTEAAYRKSIGYDQHWSLVLREWVEREPLITLLLNTEAHALRVRAARIAGVTAVTLDSGLTRRIQAPLYIDASGDGFLGHAAGAAWQHGREGRSEHNESLAPENPDQRTMGSSIAFRAVDTGRPVPFVPPPWALRFPDHAAFPFRTHRNIRQGYWWLEYGGELNTIYDNERIYRKLLAILFGIWDHIKNHGDHGAENYVINWISSFPAKRESRRLAGDYVLTQNDVVDHTPFPDAVAYGGWPIDLHPPEGFFYRGHPGSPPPFVFPGLYHIPFRCLYARDIDNLMMAGRNISVSHVALGTTRVMATCALLGQAVGTAASLALKHDATPRQIAARHMRALQALLARQDCALPGTAVYDAGDPERHCTAGADSAMRLGLSGAPDDALPLVAPARDPDVHDPCNSPPADRRRAQMFPVSGDWLEAVSVWFNNPGAAPLEVDLELHEACGYNRFESAARLGAVRRSVPPGRHIPVRFELRAPVKARRLYYLQLAAVPGLEVCCSRRYLPGLYLKPDGCYPVAGNMVFRPEPQQMIFEAANAVDGHTRAGAWPHMWISDPERGLPQHLELRFAQPRRIAAVEAIFDTNLHQATLCGPAAECVRDYRIELLEGARRHAVAEVRGNYFRRRRHVFPARTADGLRLTVSATNGDPSARVYGLWGCAGS